MFDKSNCGNEMNEQMRIITIFLSSSFDTVDLEGDRPDEMDFVGKS